MRSSRLFVPLFVIASVAGIAQEKPVPPDRTGFVPADSISPVPPGQAPVISLPEFEIEGTEIINLERGTKSAADDKWSLRGTSLAQSPGNRGATITQLGSAASAGISQGSGGVTGRLLAGYGSFRTPTLDLLLGASSASGGLTLTSGYESSRGHLPDADYREGSASLAGNLNLGGETFLPGVVTVSGILGFEGASYQPYGSAVPDLERTLNMFLGSVGFAGTGTESGASYDVGLSVVHGSLADTVTSRETEVGLAASGRIPIEEVLLQIGAEGWRDYYSTPVSSQDPYLAGGSADARYTVGKNLHLSGGVGLYGYRGSAGGSSFRVFPMIGLAWQATDVVTLGARFAPTVERPGLMPLVRRNRYVANEVELQPVEYRTHVELSSEIQASSAVSARVLFRYQKAKNLPVFVEQTGPGGAALGLWGVEYSGTTRIFGVEAELSAALSEESLLLFSFAWLDADNPDFGGEIPYAPKVQGGALYRHRFPFGLTAQTDLTLLGRRYADPGGAGQLKAFTIWNASVEYEVMSPFTIGLGVANILDRVYQEWRGYLERPRTAMLYGRYVW